MRLSPHAKIVLIPCVDPQFTIAEIQYGGRVSSRVLISGRTPTEAEARAIIQRLPPVERPDRKRAS